MKVLRTYRRGAKSFSFRVVLFICAAAALFGACSQTKDTAKDPPPTTKPRAAGPAQVSKIDDAKFKELLKPSGKPLLVNFWATWCGPCREEFPDLVKIDNEYREKIDFITVSLDFEEELTTGVPKFLKEMNASMPTYLLVSEDENTLVNSVSKNWNGALPFTILYDRNGGVSYLREGKVSHEGLKQEIERTIGK